MPVQIPDSHLDLIDGPNVVMLATIMPNGAPQVTPVWANRAGDNMQQIWVNSAVGRRKDRNMRERPQVTIAMTDPADPLRYLEIRGNVVEMVEGEAARNHLDELSHLYWGRAFDFSNPTEIRCIYKIEPYHVNIQ